jgi:uncharacterized protein
MMRRATESARRRKAFSGTTRLVAAGGLMLALLLPAQAQFWSPFGAPRRPPAAIQQAPTQQQQFNPFGGFFGPPPDQQRQAAPADNSHAPAAQPRRADLPPPTASIVVLGDAMADWLAYGLEDAYSERTEISIVRKGRIGSGLISYDPKRNVEWAQAAREAIAAEKPKFVVMMVGTNDHQQIRVVAPARAQNGKPATGPQSPAVPSGEGTPTEDIADAENPDQPAVDTGRNNNASPAGPFEFHTDQWEAAYIRRIDATIAALKSGGVPVFWVGLPAQRGPKASQDASYLNDLYRARAERAGIVYVDVWDGFVDEQGRYSPQGPDFEGQIRRLRSADGIYFTKAGARKLAHYVEREVDRSEANRAIPVALPSSIDAAPLISGKPGSSARPLVGPVIPLTITAASAKDGGDQLLGGAAPKPAVDPIAARVLIKGEAISAPTGRADDFNWPRGIAATVTAEPISPSPPTVAAKGSPAPDSGAGQKSAKPAASASTANASTTGAGSTYQRIDPNSVADDNKPKVAKKPAPAPSPFQPIPNIFR